MLVIMPSGERFHVHLTERQKLLLLHIRRQGLLHRKLLLLLAELRDFVVNTGRVLQVRWRGATSSLTLVQHLLSLFACR